MEKGVAWIQADECRNCGGTLVPTTGSFPVRVGSETVDVDATLRVCRDCGETLYDPQELRSLNRKAASILRKREGLLTPEEIKAIRGRSGLTQSQFENALFLGKKSLVRWESGQICQSGAADSLLRAVDEFPALMSFLLGVRGRKADFERAAPITTQMIAGADPTFGRPDIVSITPLLARNAYGDSAALPFRGNVVAPKARSTTKVALG